MKLAVFEYLCGGGLAQESEESQDLEALYSEGHAMLSSLVEDLIRCGHSVTTMLDERSMARWEQSTQSSQTLSGCSLIPFTKCLSLADAWTHASKNVDRVIVIAPEIDDALCDVVRSMRTENVPVFAPSIEFLRQASDKRQLAQMMRDVVAHPMTLSLQEVADLGKTEASLRESQWVVKPIDGAGCFGIKRFPNLSSLQSALTCGFVEDNTKQADRWIAQPWISGIPMSCAVVVHSDGVVEFVGACEQLFSKGAWTDAGAEWKYLGGRGRWLPSEWLALQDFVRRILQVFPGGQGWIGFDFLKRANTNRLDEGLISGSLSDEEFVLIEINPRLTTSYLAYRKWYGHRLAESVVGISSLPKATFMAEPIEFGTIVEPLSSTVHEHRSSS